MGRDMKGHLITGEAVSSRLEAGTYFLKMKWGYLKLITINPMYKFAPLLY
jgi:hypothetical protein